MQNPVVWSNLGFLYLAKNEYQLALDNFNKALKLSPKDAYALNNRGYAKFKLNDKKGALKDINQSLDLLPGNSYAYRNRALIYMEGKETEKACEDLYKAKQLGFTELYGNEVDELIDSKCKNLKK